MLFKGTFHVLSLMFTFRREEYTLEVIGGPSWPWYVGPKRHEPEGYPTRPEFTLFLLRVAWSGMSHIGPRHQVHVNSLLPSLTDLSSLHQMFYQSGHLFETSVTNSLCMGNNEKGRNP